MAGDRPVWRLWGRIEGPSGKFMDLDFGRNSRADAETAFDPAIVRKGLQGLLARRVAGGFGRGRHWSFVRHCGG